MRNTPPDGRHSLTLRQQIDQVCVRFETVWVKGKVPRIEDYLTGADPDQSALLRELILLDLYYRRMAGEDPRPEDYLSRFKDLDAEWLVAASPTRLAANPEAALAARVPAFVPITSTAGLIAALQTHRLLDPTQQQELPYLDVSFPEPKALARELLQRGWLTPYQINQLFSAGGKDLLLGSYVLLERLGQGAMGRVFKARNWKLGRVVALKIMQKARLTDPEAVKRFCREIRAAAELDHPNIVHALDADQVGDTWLFTMEYVAGSDLKKLVQQQGPLPAEVACEYVRQAALGLQHAHDRGWIHRDIKPANMLLSLSADAVVSGGAVGTPLNGRVKILDLGLAKMRLADQERITSLTPDARFMGTPDYIAPEQAVNARRADHRADLYSLGCTFYFLLTGQVPFPGDSYQEKIDRHRWDEPVPVEQLRTQIPPALGAIVRKLMAKKPEERYQTAAELAEALANFRAESASEGPTLPVAGASDSIKAKKDPFAVIATSDTESRPDSPRRLQRAADKRLAWIIVAAGGAILAGLLTLCAAVLLRPDPSPRAIEPETPTDPDKVARRNALRALKEHALQVEECKADLDPFLEKLLDFRRDHPNTQEAKEAASLLKGLKEELPEQLVAVMGKHRGRHWGEVRGVVYSPDGRLLASCGDDRGIVRLWDATTLRLRAVLKGHGNGYVHSVAFSPDSQTLASAGNDYTVRLWNVAGGQEPLVLKGHKHNGVSSVAFHPNGELLASGSGDGTVRLWEVATGKGRTLRGHEGGVTHVTFSPDGEILASASEDRTIRLWEVNSGNEKSQLKGHNGPVIRVAFTPDGSTLVSSSRTPNQTLLWNLNPPSENGALMGTASFFSLAFPRTNSDLLAASSSSGGRVLLWRRITGAWQKPEEFKESQSVAVMAVDWSPDGNTLAGGAGSAIRLWDMTKPLVKEKEQPEHFPPVGHRAGVRSLAYDPDSKILATGGADFVVRLWRLGGEKPTLLRVIPGDGVYAVDGVALSKDGKLLAVAGHEKVSVWDVQAKSEKPLFQVEGQVTPTAGLAFNPNGDLLASPVVGKGDGKEAVDVVLWDMATYQRKHTHQRKHTLWGHAGKVNCLAFSPDGRLLATGSHDKTVRLWDVEKGTALHTLTGYASPVLSVAFSPDSKLIVAGGTTNPVKVWNVKGEEVGSFPREGSYVRAVAFISNTVLVIAGNDGRIVWRDLSLDKSKGKVDPWQLPGGVWAVAVVDGGKYLATANTNGTIYLLRCP